MPVTEAAKQRLIDYFGKHPAWKSAAAPLADGVCSALQFEGEPEAWRLIRRNGESILELGEPVNPDFSFTFSEGAIAYLTELEDATIGDFATRLFECCFTMGEDRRIELRVISSVGQIVKRRYWIIAVKGGMKVLKIARAHGLGSLTDFRRVMGLLQHKSSAEVREALLAQKK